MREKIKKAVLAAIGGAFMAGDKFVELSGKAGEEAKRLVAEAVQRGEVEKGEISDLLDETYDAAQEKLSQAKSGLLAEINEAAKRVAKATEPPRRRGAAKKK